ncbi:MAG: tRNA dihydrouridine(20/20a) synthase DusA [Gammaproteobacteria bacterium]|nr:tRNA dihydrouridine(20/20a) synthase DusA [Gammaproteobacteria bacterium]
MAESTPAPMRRFAVAPMLDVTDRHCRYLLRLISRHALLYTEMVTTGALLRGDTARHLAFDDAEHPVALQLGGSDAGAMTRCARLAAGRGYDEVNINVGCPSERVRDGAFGAALMAEPHVVADCVASMTDTVDLPVTVKCRIGIDHQDDDALADFVGIVAGAGCRTFIVHARKAWLSGLSPRDNRTIPPLRYELVYRLKREFPHLEIIINGGIADLESAAPHLERVDGVMLGRAIQHDPYLLAKVDRTFFADPTPLPTRLEVVEAYLPYVEAGLAAGVPLNAMAQPLLGLFLGQPGARLWRRHLSEHMHRDGAGLGVITTALHQLERAAA